MATKPTFTQKMIFLFCFSLKFIFKSFKIKVLRVSIFKLNLKNYYGLATV